MINFDIEKKGYNKEQVSKYFERVQEEYEEVFSENQSLRIQLQNAQKQLDRERSRVSDIPPDQMEAIALALIDAETEAKRIVTTAREKAWQILTDAKKGLPVSEETEKRSLPISTEKIADIADTVAYQPREPSTDTKPKSAIENDIDKLLESILSQNRLGGD